MVIYQTVVSTFNVCNPRTLSGCEPLLLCMVGKRHYVPLAVGGEQRSHESALLMSLSPDTFWKLAIAEIKENHKAILSLDILQMRPLVGDRVQGLGRFLLNSFVNCTIVPHFGTVCSLLFNVVSSLLWQLPNSSCDAAHQHPNNVKQLQ